jgi:hypothetical protein
VYPGSGSIEPESIEGKREMRANANRMMIGNNATIGLASAASACRGRRWPPPPVARKPLPPPNVKTDH